MTDTEIIKALEKCPEKISLMDCKKCPLNDLGCAKYALDLINRQIRDLTKKVKSEAYKEFAEKIEELLSRYSHLHKYADEARHNTEEYADGTPIEMVSVWEVLSLKKWEMVDYETMSTLQKNIETIAKERLLSEFEKDLRLLFKEMGCED